ncbi:WD40 repeat domain-containing protein [Halobacillus sp. Marseille-P3879]|uniref:WD40 repeat domain-containing protein n=1 Tax=Halobacillus sp. Marseille-P3879 TaxID=2045014 RepID=UPI00358F1E52
MERRDRMELHTIDAHSSHVNKVKYHPEESLILSAGFNGELYLWDAVKGKKMEEYSGHKVSVNSVQWIEGGNKLVSASADGTVLLHEISASEPLKTIHDLKSGVSHLRFTYDHRYLLTSNKQSMLRIREWPDGELVHKLKSDQQNSGVLTTASTDLHAIVGGVGSKLRRYLIPSGEILEEFEGHETAVMGFRFIREDSHAVSVGYDGTLNIWDMENHQKIESYSLGGEGYYSIAVSPDEKEVAIAMPYKLLRLRLKDLKTEQHGLPAKGNYSVDYLSNGKQLAIASADKKVRLIFL